MRCTRVCCWPGFHVWRVTSVCNYKVETYIHRKPVLRFFRSKVLDTLKQSVIYKTSETYIGLTENAFKTRSRNHTASFRHTKHRNSTELSKHVWSLKDNNIDYSISWRIISSSSSYNSSSKRCNLCLKEKFLIICRPLKFSPTM